jgi:hypothetical protein
MDAESRWKDFYGYEGANGFDRIKFIEVRRLTFLCDTEIQGIKILFARKESIKI